ncbi:MAG: hypothetical protein ACE5E1_05040 [Phycisphaerae bacterium]
MQFRLRQVTYLGGLAWFLIGAVWVGIGCGPTSPFLAAQFNASLLGTPTLGSPAQPPTDGSANAGDGGAVASVCDLPVNEQTIAVTIQNESQQFVEFSMTFLVSAGPGGFVCDDQIQDYLNAGYSDAILPGSANSVSVGCDVISLNSGTRILSLEFGVNQGPQATIPPNVGGDPTATLPTLSLRRRDNGSTAIPLPELIVFGNEDPDFICTGGTNLGDLCTQRGVVYVSSVGIPVGKSVEAARLQGTVCAENFGTAPEWRLDKTLDSQVQPFQYGRGGAIIMTVLDRASDALDNTRNQAVWLVTDADDNTLHFPDR